MGKHYCSASFCNNNSDVEGLSFTRVRPEWTEFCERSPSWTPSQFSRICSEHFLESQINGRRGIRAGAMPFVVRLTGDTQSGGEVLSEEVGSDTAMDTAAMQQFKQEPEEDMEEEDAVDPLLLVQTSLQQTDTSPEESVKVRLHAYACDQCDYTTAYNGDLKRHVNTKHIGLKYNCDDCDYATSDIGNLNKHRNSIHIGVRYPCKLCNYAPTRPDSLKYHMRRKHFLQLGLEKPPIPDTSIPEDTPTVAELAQIAISRAATVNLTPLSHPPVRLTPVSRPPTVRLTPVSRVATTSVSLSPILRTTPVSTIMIAKPTTAAAVLRTTPVRPQVVKRVVASPSILSAKPSNVISVTPAAFKKIKLSAGLTNAPPTTVPNNATTAAIVNAFTNSSMAIPEDMKPAVPGTATSPSTVTNKPVINKSITKYINSLTTKSVSILATTTENDEVADCDDSTVSSTDPLDNVIKLKRTYKKRTKEADGPVFDTAAPIIRTYAKPTVFKRPRRSSTDEDNTASSAILIADQSDIDCKDEPQSCDQCEFLGENSAALYTHKKSSHASAEGYPLQIRVQCEHCDYVGSQSALSHHKKAKHGGARLHCEHCDYTTTKISHLKAHTEAIHEGIRYPCNECEFSASQRSQLKRHKKARHGPGRFYPCILCQFLGSEPEDLNKHVGSTHGWFHCEQCDYKTIKENILRRHVQFTHYRSCDVGSCTFHTESLEVLENHKLAFHSDKPADQDIVEELLQSTNAAVNARLSKYKGRSDHSTATRQKRSLDNSEIREIALSQLNKLKSRKSVHLEENEDFEDDPLGLDTLEEITGDNDEEQQVQQKQQHQHQQQQQRQEEESEDSEDDNSTAVFLTQTFIIFEESRLGKLKL